MTIGMWGNIKNFLRNEAVYLIGAPTLVLLGIVLYGIFFDHWYKDLYNISLASLLLYVLSIIFRFLGWISGKFKH
jgi:hypothetical protein